MTRKPIVIAAMDTPMTDDGNHIDPDRIPPLVAFLRAHGVQGLFVAGSTGLGPLLRDDEWRVLVQTTLQHTTQSSPVRVLINVTAPTTWDTLDRVDFALEQGARHVVVATPAAYRYEQRAILHYFQRVFERATPAGVYLYRKHGDDWGYKEVMSFRHTYENFKGIKDSATDMASHLSLLSVPGLEVYQGYEALIASSLLAGGAGPVSGLATALPHPVVELTKMALRESTSKSDLWTTQQRLATVRALVCGTNPYAAFKALLHWQGVPVGVPREPFIPLGDEETSRMVEALASFRINLKRESTPSRPTEDDRV